MHNVIECDQVIDVKYLENGIATLLCKISWARLIEKKDTRIQENFSSL